MAPPAGRAPKPPARSEQGTGPAGHRVAGRRRSSATSTTTKTGNTAASPQRTTSAVCAATTTGSNTKPTGDTARSHPASGPGPAQPPAAPTSSHPTTYPPAGHDGCMTQASTDMADYYQQRASYYDRIYEIPERQSDLRRLQELVPAALAGRDVLEVAAGTGYWTQFVASTATSVCAADVNDGPLAVAAARDYPRGNVRFARGDAFGLDQVPGVFTGALVGFWWSHLLRGQTAAFLDGLRRRLEPGSPVVVIDNRYVEGSGSPIVEVDG